MQLRAFRERFCHSGLGPAVRTQVLEPTHQLNSDLEKSISLKFICEARIIFSNRKELPNSNSYFTDKEMEKQIDKEHDQGR